MSRRVSDVLGERKQDGAVPATRIRDVGLAFRPEERLRVLAMNPVSRETEQRLDKFVALLSRWQRATNLVSPASLPAIWTRHIADSLQLLRLAPDARRWIDLGSGGGFPGVVVACALADYPDAVVHLVESNAKKAAFLHEAARIAAGTASVHHRRAEAFIEAWEDKADIVTTRAFASLSVLLDLTAPLLQRGAKALFLKGQHVERELTHATKCWNIDFVRIPSRTDSKASILEIRRAERKPSS
jgi:16S rRNA (guanine527-N7)-methyltransferase